MTPSTWKPESWRGPEFDLDQQPNWPDRAALQATLKVLQGKLPLIYAGESRKLKSQLAKASLGEAFVLQAGDCAETFQEFSADRVKNLMKVILQMAAVLTYSSGVPTVKVGRVAGQFAKPRSNDTEEICGEVLPVYRGDMVNSVHTTAEDRRPNPERILQAYDQAANTLNLLGSFAKGGFADLSKVHEWNMEFVATSNEGQRYESIASGIDSALGFMRACGVDMTTLHEVDFFSSHEALILDYEEALTRQDSTANDEWYDCSAHMLWIGTRTIGLDSAHVEFLRGVGNPIGVKIDKKMTPDRLVALCERLNPGRERGRLTLVSRMGRGNVQKFLPKLVKAVETAGHPVLWMCDPMHGNTFSTESGLKTRRVEDIVDEISEYFQAHAAAGTWPGGIHLELTGEDVTECLGGSDNVEDDDLHFQYLTACDPRLNARQSLDLVFQVAELLAKNT